MLSTLWRFVRLILLAAVLAALLQRSTLPVNDPAAEVRFFTRDLEFDYVEWTLNAVWVKVNQSALGIHRYLTDEQGASVVLEFIDLTRRIQQQEARLREVLSDPAMEEPPDEATELEAALRDDYQLRRQLGPLAETVFQAQIAAVLEELKIATGGQPLPPVLYHMTPAPLALIVSPREVIRQDYNISILPDLTVEQQITLEDTVASALDVSTLVVPIGGIGVYPTMVTQTSNLNWLAEVVGHEWTHNFFTLRPLGLSYLSSPELRTMNETAAAIAGKEIGRRLIERFYPAFAPAPEPESPPVEETEPEVPPEPVFDFREEMRETRLNVDRLLEEGKIDQAESYMELRRRFFWDHGYRLRKLNQAYFAFYGAYADVPGGAAGDDPVAAAVRELRERSGSLAEFMNTISWMGSFEDLQAYLSP